MPGLDDLLISLAAIPDEDLRDFALPIYLKELVRASILDHAGKEISFYDNAFEHAFYDKLPGRYSKRRDVACPERIERIRWIAPIIGGKIPETECWNVPSPTGRRHPSNRAYICWSRPYIVRLEPKMNGQYKFVTAYPADTGYLRRTIRGGGLEWRYGTKKEAL